MTLEYTYKLLNIISLKENNGNLFNKDDFNIYIEAKYPEFIKEKIEEYENYQNSPTVKQPVLNAKYLQTLLDNDDIVIITGYGSLPSTFLYWKSATCQYDSKLEEVSLITESDKDYRLTHLLGKRPERYMFGVLRGTYVYVWPKNISSVNVTFYKKPIVPFLDYYIDADDNEVYLSQGAVGVTVPVGGTTSLGVSGPTTVNSNTIELDIPIDLQYEFMNHILSALGVRIGVPAITQYAELQQQKETAQ